MSMSIEKMGLDSMNTWVSKFLRNRFQIVNGKDNNYLKEGDNSYSSAARTYLLVILQLTYD